MLFALVAAISAAACSFPSVDYYDASSTTSTGGGCTAPKPCDTQAIQCGNSAESKRSACANACKPNDTACTDDCESTYEDDVTVCTSSCASCAEKNGCAEATASCTALATK
jgi:hypothetical protein